MLFETHETETKITAPKAQWLLLMLSCSKNTFRSHLCTVLFDLRDNALITTDGTSLQVLRSRDLDMHKACPDLGPKFVLERGGLDQAIKSLKASDSMSISFDLLNGVPAAEVRTPYSTETLEISTETFPDYAQVLPRTSGIAPWNPKTKYADQDALAFNSKVLGDYLAGAHRIKKSVPVALTTMIDATSPMVFETRSPDDDLFSTFVLMPMRL